MTKWSDRQVLVVGGAGYVGTVLVDALLTKGARVRVFDSFLYDHGRSLQGFWERPGFSCQLGDLRKPSDREQALSSVTDVVLLASLVGDPISKKYPDLTSAVNDQGSRALFEDLKTAAVQRFIFTSTCSNYGLRDSDEPATETSDLHPLSLYAETKVAFEKFILAQAADINFSPVVLRIATAFGTSFRMRFDLTVNEFVYHLAKGHKLDVYDRDTWRPYCHTRDIAGAVIAALEAPSAAIHGEVFNVGRDDNNYTKQMIVDEIAKHIPIDVSYVDRGADRRNYRVAFDKISNQLGFEPKILVRDFIPDLIAAVQAGLFDDAEERPSTFGNYEIANDKLAVPGPV